MKIPRSTCLSLSIACTLAFTILPRATAQPGTAANAKALIEEAKKNQQERKRAAMQKELDRITEDAKNGKQEIADLEQSISRVGSALTETKASLDQIAGRKRNVIQDLELLNLRTDAEKLKEEALTLLGIAHSKSMEALTKRNEELDLRSAVVSAEIQKASEPESTSDSEARKPKGDSGPSLSELRRNLDKAQGRRSVADSRAREAMDIAARKLLQAESAAAKVEKRQAEFAAEKISGAPADSTPPKPKTKKGN